MKNKDKTFKQYNIAGHDEHMAESLEEADKQMLIDDVMVVINSNKDNVYCTRQELARKIIVICQWDLD